MSSALVRQALELVDGEESGGRRRKRGAARARRPDTGQEQAHPYKQKGKKVPQENPSPPNVEETVRKLLALSKPTADATVTDKIVKRAVKGRPLLEKIEAKKDEGGSIFFPDEPEESFAKFEREYFCS